MGQTSTEGGYFTQPLEAAAGTPIRSGCTAFSLDSRRESQEALEDEGELRRPTGRQIDR